MASKQGNQKNRKKTPDERIASGEIIEQKIWQFIKELNSGSDEQLDAIALVQGKRKYSYRQMFRWWERYAEVFSALGITEQNRSRVGIMTSPDPVSVFVFYALNMLGVSVSMIHFMDLMDEGNWEKQIQKEKITDMLFCDQRIRPQLLQRILRSKDKLGLRSVIVFRAPSEDPYMPRELALMSEINYWQLKHCRGALFMDELLEKYDAAPIAYGSGKNADDAVIIHTSGTTSGIHKPIPLSDRGMNEGAARMLRDERFAALRSKAVTCLTMDLTGGYALVDMVHTPLALGGRIATVPLGEWNPRFIDAFVQYGGNVLFTSTISMDTMSTLNPRVDLSGLVFAYVGGSYVSAENKKRWNGFFKDHGAKVRIVNGYGLSEIGGACILADPEREDDAIGRPLPGVKVKIFDEDEEIYYDPADGPRTGVLFLASPSVSCGQIDGETFFSLTEIDGEQYLNTYDLVTVNEDGTLTCIGRMNKFFVNNEGIRFDAGLVETAVAAQPGIDACALAPEYDKIMHDTFPVLYVKTAGNEAQAVQTVRQALYNVFVKDGKIVDTNLPGQCALTDRLPYTATGKVDVHQIIKDKHSKARYKVEPVRIGGRLQDVRLIPAFDAPAAWTGIPEEYENKHRNVLKMFSDNKPGSGTGFGSPFGMPDIKMDWKPVLDLFLSFFSERDAQARKDEPQSQTNEINYLFEEVFRMMKLFIQMAAPMGGPQPPFTPPQQPPFAPPQQPPFAPPQQPPFAPPQQPPFAPPQQPPKDAEAPDGKKQPQNGAETPDGKKRPDPGPIMDILARLFRASSHDSFFEE